MCSSDLINQVSQTRGIICFSSDWCDPVLWSHYADQHHGIALGFDVQDSFAMDVNYSERLVDFSDFYLQETDTLKSAFIQKVISSKYTNWKYEKEVRLFVGLDEPDTKIGHFFKNFDPNLSLRSVVFGSRYHNHEEMAVILSHIRKDANVDCWKAALGEKTFEMRKDPNWTYQTVL